MRAAPKIPINHDWFLVGRRCERKPIPETPAPARNSHARKGAPKNPTRVGNGVSRTPSDNNAANANEMSEAITTDLKKYFVK